MGGRSTRTAELKGDRTVSTGDVRAATVRAEVRRTKWWHNHRNGVIEAQNERRSQVGANNIINVGGQPRVVTTVSTQEKVETAATAPAIGTTGKGAIAGPRSKAAWGDVLHLSRLPPIETERLRCDGEGAAERALPRRVGLVVLP